MNLISLEEINRASAFIEPFILQTPLEEAPGLTPGPDGGSFLKLENLQVTGSFKIRGALYKLGRLRSEGVDSVITSSAGNHGWAMAMAGKWFNCSVEVFVPASIDEAKCRGMAALGARIVKCPGPGYDEAQEIALEASHTRGVPFVSPYDDEMIMAGNGGTLGLEILRQFPGAGSILFPVGGGGLGAGLASCIRQKKPGVRLIGCQHRESPALALSLAGGEAVTSLPAIETIAGGIEGGIGARTFAILRHTIDQVALVGEDELKKAILWLIRHHRYLVEASGAAPLAACLFHPDLDIPGPAVLVLTGRNIGLPTLASIIREELCPVDKY